MLEKSYSRSTLLLWNYCYQVVGRKILYHVNYKANDKILVEVMFL